jgi:hypothetical protein
MGRKKHLGVAETITDSKKWQEEEDARTLARAEEIKSDKERMKGASRGAKRMLEDVEASVKGLKKVARKK